MTIKFSTYFKNRICLLASCNQGCDLKNRLTIGKFSTIDTSNSSREMDAKKTTFLFIMNFQILVLRVVLGPGELRLKAINSIMRLHFEACYSLRIFLIFIFI